jgi:hypothetical protein
LAIIVVFCHLAVDFFPPLDLVFDMFGMHVASTSINSDIYTLVHHTER